MSLATLTLTALRRAGAPPLPGYSGLLRAAFAADPPPFGLAWYGRTFRRCARDPVWLASALLRNALREGAGAQRLWEFAGRIADGDVAGQVRRHALDERRHSLMYVATFNIVFPAAAPTEGARRALAALAPTLRDARTGRSDHLSSARVLDELIQMNIGEIRTCVNQLLMTPVVIAHCQRGRRPRLRRLLRVLLRDEGRHIRYTAMILERAVGSGQRAFIQRTLAKRLEQFNRTTIREVRSGMSTE